MIALRVGKVINKFKMAKHFTLQITDEAFTFSRNDTRIAAEAARYSRQFRSPGRAPPVECACGYPSA